MVRVIAKNFVRPECIEEFKNLALELVAETQKEPGCIEYNLHQCVAIPTWFTILECWESQAHLDAHCKTKHFTEICPQFEPLIERPGDVTFIKE